MTTVIVLAAVIAVLVAGAAVFLVRRSVRPEAPEAVPPADRPRPRGEPAGHPAGPTAADVVAEAEAILARAQEDAAGGDTTVAEPEAPPEAPEVPPVPESGTAVEAPARKRPSLRQRLGRTRRAFTDRLAEIRLRRSIDQEVWDDLEESLVLADVGVTVASDLVASARERAKAEGAGTAADAVDALKAVMADTLAGSDRSLHRGEETSVWLVTGVNGSGKTTTIGKLASDAAGRGEKVVLAAADTFRAAAGEQLSVWAERTGAELVAGQEGSDPGAVVFDAVSFARARDCDLLLVDTAGRLQTKVNLMEELKKIRRVAENAGGTPDEVLLVLDATTGQNGISQAREFARAVGVTGVVLTKLDGTAKGGIAFAVEAEFAIPIKLVGVGEGVDDLTPFDPDEFVDALFD